MNFRETVYIIFIFLGCIECKDKPVVDQEPPVVEANRDTSATPVRTALCREGIFEYRIEANGILKADKELKIIATTNGQIKNTNLKTGAFVTAGQTIIEYDTDDIKARLDRAEITRYNAQKDYESQLISYEKLFTNQSTEEKQAIDKKLKASTGLLMAEQEINELNLQLSKAYLKIPFNGYIADLKVIAAQHVKQGDELFTLLSAEQLMECMVLESDITSLHTGQPAEIKTIALPDVSLKGTIKEINPKVETGGISKVYISVPQAHKNKLYPGMHAQAIIKVPGRRSLLVPKEAVVVRGNRSVIFTLVDKLSKWNYVEVGRNNGVEIEVLTGLNKNDKVITTNNLQLAHEAVVREER